MEDAPKDTWDSFGVAKKHCNEISNQIMDLYEERDLLRADYSRRVFCK